MGEHALGGVSAAPGITFGKAIVLDRAGQTASEPVPTERRADEAARAVEALRLAAADLEAISAELRDAGRPHDADIVETGVLMALDPQLVSSVERLVAEDGLEAGLALRAAADQTAAELMALDDPMLALRADDVRSIGARAASRLAGRARHVTGGILIANTLGPADVAELAPRVEGIALAYGGVTAHAAIVARSLGLPMVVGVGTALLGIQDGEEVVVDGDHGAVVRSPSQAYVNRARLDADTRRRARDHAISRRLESARTKDGRSVRVLANASTAAELREALAQGAEGVGLLRSELLFLESRAWPDAEDQVRAMRPVMEMLEGKTATVRLFDFGGDKTPPFLRGTTKRGIDLLLEFPDRLRDHIHAIVTASRGTELRLLVPMVTTPEQLEQVRLMLGDSVAAIGAMIETPAAARSAREIAGRSKFLSIGTNDLTQLVLGLDRELSKTAPVLDPRVLNLIAATARAGRDVGIAVDVCGEAASDANVMPVLVGLGVDELSVAAARVGQVREWVRGLIYDECVRRAEGLLDEARDASRKGN